MTIRYSEAVSETSVIPGKLLRDARMQCGLTQTELAHRAGVTQSVISSYESGARQPSLPTLSRLIAATGMELAVDIRKPSRAHSPLSGPLGRRVRQRGEELTRAAAARGASNLRVFGSVARGDDTAESDVDLLVDLDPGTGLLGLSALERDLSAILETRVDVIPANGLKSEISDEILSEAICL